jgi:tRNA pseudouridine38-40 synthase
VAHCDLPYFPENLPFKLNRLLPEDISVKRAVLAPKNFHALASSVGKTYVYRVWNEATPNPFIKDFSLWISKPLDLRELNALAEVFLGTHDFKSFQTRGTPVPDTTRTLKISRWVERRKGLLEYQVRGDGFLKQMVRNLVGLQLFALRKGLTPEDLRMILNAKDRQAAKDTAPAHGLILWKVHYLPPSY